MASERDGYSQIPEIESGVHNDVDIQYPLDTFQDFLIAQRIHKGISTMVNGTVLKLHLGLDAKAIKKS